MAKSNLTPAERERIRQEAASRRAEKENRIYYILIGVTLIVLAAFLLAPAVKDFFTLPAEIRDVSAIQDDWLVIDADNKVSKRYHHPASFVIPQGYEKGEFTKYNDGVAQDFYLLNTDNDAPVNLVYVDAAPELNAQEYIQRTIDMHANALNEGSTVTLSEPFTATIAGEKAQCIYLHFSTLNGDYGSLVCGFDAPRSVCVTAVISGSYTTPENVQTQEQLLAEAEILLAGLTIVR